MHLCWTTRSKHECRPKQLCLYLVYLFLRIEDGIDKLLVRNLPVEMLLYHIIVYLEFDVFKKFLSGPCLYMERRIPVIGDIDADKLCAG